MVQHFRVGIAPPKILTYIKDSTTILQGFRLIPLKISWKDNTQVSATWDLCLKHPGKFTKKHPATFNMEHQGLFGTWISWYPSQIKVWSRCYLPWVQFWDLRTPSMSMKFFVCNVAKLCNSWRSTQGTCGRCTCSCFFSLGTFRTLMSEVCLSLTVVEVTYFRWFLQNNMAQMGPNVCLCL